MTTRIAEDELLRVGGATATVEAPIEIDVSTLNPALTGWSVLLWNDDHNSMDHVVRSLVRSVQGLSVNKAVQIMLEAHNSGRAIVTTCPLELAELYRDRLESCGLTATIESA